MSWTCVCANPCGQTHGHSQDRQTEDFAWGREGVQAHVMLMLMLMAANTYEPSLHSGPRRCIHYVI